MNLLRANVLCTGAYVCLKLDLYREAYELADELAEIHFLPNVFQ